MVFYGSLSDSKSPQVSRILLSIKAVLSNAVIWMVSTRPFISKSSSTFINPLGTVPRAQIKIDTNVTFMFPSFFNSTANSRYLSLFHNFAISTIFLVFFFVDYHKVWYYLLRESFSHVLVDGYLLEFETVRRLKFPETFSVFWPFSTML